MKVNPLFEQIKFEVSEVITALKLKNNNHEAPEDPLSAKEDNSAQADRS